MSKTIKQDQALMDILKVSTVIRLICETNMGALKLNIRKGEQNYFFTLDAVELPKDLNKEIYELLYVPEIPQVNILPKVVYSNIPKLTKEQEDKLANVVDDTDIDVPLPHNIKLVKKGRPKGSVNKIKNVTRKANT